MTAAQTVTRSLPAPEIAGDAAASLLALADDEFMIGHRHSEWLGLSPFLEEDLAVSSIAQDELGHARALYALIWPSWNSDEREAGVTRRPIQEWTSSALADRAGGPWEQALVRHWFYDMLETLRWTALVTAFASTVSGLTNLSERVLVEERYHAHHSDSLVRRLVRVDQSKARLQSCARVVVADAIAMGELVIGVDVTLRPTVEAMIDEACEVLAIPVPRPADDATSNSSEAGRAERIADVFEQLTQVSSVDPSATW
jgi:ring-1,2-phenylacetyl-CoA epoxidase subunit PaaC